MVKELLIVDDQPGIRLLLQDILTSEGYEVTVATTGKEALDYIIDQTFDLIILDYKLPILDGKELLQQLEKRKMTTPAILMSGLAEDIDKEAQQFSMVQEVLAKPFNVEDITKIVSRLLQKNAS
ncbi:response regulator [Oceanobacillus halotolerans]|uniref:response regulator n=1 Tax=Oceanobacillus halotolerans TaxID=2663380 RepID=UPI0013DD3EA4|nr:response regulator [Oceanobacillus halotolerans]